MPSKHHPSDIKLIFRCIKLPSFHDWKRQLSINTLLQLYKFFIYIFNKIWFNLHNFHSFTLFRLHVYCLFGFRHGLLNMNVIFSRVHKVVQLFPGSLNRFDTTPVRFDHFDSIDVCIISFYIYCTIDSFLTR